VLATPAVLDDANSVVLSPAVLVCADVLVMTAVGDEGVLALEKPEKAWWWCSQRLCCYARQQEQV